jgi:hypothetical protein
MGPFAPQMPTNPKQCENPKRVGPKSTQVIVQQQLPVIKGILETIVTCLFWKPEKGRLGPKKIPFIGPKSNPPADFVQKSS